MSASLQRKAPGALTSTTPQTRELNAETVTAIATGFLKRIGNKGNLKPKRVSLEEGIYTVEVELKKFIALVKVDAETHGIKEYEIQPKGEETPFISVSPKIIAMIFGISTVVYVALYFAFRILGL
ncbi:MAG: hypothetical protein QXR76_00330 [Candidatus Bathyarchaeia archaeon]